MTMFRRFPRNSPAWCRRLLLPLLVLSLVACARTVTVALPPQVELAAYPTIGLIDFAAEPNELGAAATQKFIGNLHAAQPGLRFLELGNRRDLLREVGCAELDYRAIRAIGEKYRVAAVLTGTVELSEARPDVTVAANLASISAKAKVDGRMSAKLWETTSGATAWSNSSWGSWPVAGITLSKGRIVDGGFRHPQEQQDQILMALVKALNGEFWPRYERRRVAE